jgi:putative intracellular protease/amidase
MAPNPPRRALIAVTSAQAPLHGGDHPTGLFIGEAMHPFNVFTKAGFEVDLASETGKYYVDWLSEQPSFLSGNDVTEWEDLKSDFRQKLDNMTKAEDLDSSKVNLFSRKSPTATQTNRSRAVRAILCICWTCCFDRLPTR